MDCVYPHCAGSLRTGQNTGFCTLCRQPVSACTDCGAWNRAFAVFCRQCGHANTLWQTSDPIDPQVLATAPRRTVLAQPITTAPVAHDGLLWAMGEGGDLYRLNPYARPGEQLEVHDRVWAGTQPHAFAVTRLNAALGNGTRDAQTSCAIIATADRILVTDLFTRHRRSLTPAPGETFLTNARDDFHFIAAHGDSIYALSRFADGINLHHTTLRTGETQHLTLAQAETALCGPVLLADPAAPDTAHIILWSPTALWVYTAGKLSPVPLPEALELRTAQTDSALRLPPGTSPALTGNGQLFLPATQFGRPALLRLAPAPHGWSATAIAVLDDGTLSASTTGSPLLATTNRLLVCPATAFRTLIQDSQLDPNFPAWQHNNLALFLAQANYGGLKQWLKAYADSTEIPLTWDLPEVHACNGFWTLGTALCSVCVLADRALRTEFLSWCV